MIFLIIWLLTLSQTTLSEKSHHFDSDLSQKSQEIGLALHSDLDYRIVSKKDFQTSFLGQEQLVA